MKEFANIMLARSLLAHAGGGRAIFFVRAGASVRLAFLKCARLFMYALRKNGGDLKRACVGSAIFKNAVDIFKNFGILVYRLFGGNMSKGTHMVRVTTDTHKKLRALSYMNDTSMASMIARIVDTYMETSMNVDEQGSMWRIMSVKVTHARKDQKEKHNG